MAAEFCTKCGKPISPGSQFCASCGSPTGGSAQSPGSGAPTVEFGASPASAGQPAPPAGMPLSALLGVQGSRRFLVQHLLVGPKHSYRILDPEKRHLFTVGENVRQERQEMWHNMFHPSASGQSGFHAAWGYNSVPELAYWALDDFAGNARGALGLHGTAGNADATLVDATGAPVLVVHVGRGFSSITAQATSPDGQPILEARGSTFHRNFSLHDARGVEVAKIHEPLASVRDTYAVDLVGPVDPVYAIVFAILIDHFKGK